MKPTVLFRQDQDNVEEFNLLSATKFDVITNRSHVKPNDLVVGRYSVLPYYKELEEDITYNEAKLVNSYQQHQWIAQFYYYDILKDYTFQTWKAHEMPYNDYDGPYVVKGTTNSKKHKR